MNSNAKCAATWARSVVQYTWTGTLRRLIAKLAQFQWNVFGHWVGFHSRVKGGAKMLSKRESELIVDSITLTNIHHDMRINQLAELVKELEERIRKLEESK